MNRYLIAASLSALAIVAIAGTTLAVTAPAPVPAHRPEALAQTDTPPAAEQPPAPEAPAPAPAEPAAQAQPGPEPLPLEEEVVLSRGSVDHRRLLASLVPELRIDRVHPSLLRGHEAELAEGFQIMDSEDQLRVIRRMVKGLGLDEGEWAPKEIQWFINAQKDEGLRPQDLDDEGNSGRRRMIDFYARYERVAG